MSDPLLTVQQLAARLGVPVATVYAWNSRDLGPRRLRLGKHLRYRESDIEAWLDQRAVRTRAA